MKPKKNPRIPTPKTSSNIDPLLQLRNLGISSYIDSINVNRFFGPLSSRERQEDNLARHYRNGRLVLVLGAGISREHGLPDWNTLLQKLLLSSFEDGVGPSKSSSVLAKAFTLVFSPNPLIAARYLHDYYRNPNDVLAFDKAVKQAVYEEIQMEQESELFKEIRKLCIAPRRSSNLDCIITYNYDDLIETYLENTDFEVPFKSIYAPGMHAESDEVGIYHVHGYLPQHDDLDESNKIVLSEDIYHRQYNDVYGWSNLIQINKFKDNNCLFIGMSFSDPNLRRLLDIAKVLRGDDVSHHFLIKKRYVQSEVERNLQFILEKNPDLFDEKVEAELKLEESVTKLIQVLERFETNDALSFGVEIIWINEYDEIPQILSQIRNARRSEKGRNLRVVTSHPDNPVKKSN